MSKRGATLSPLPRLFLEKLLSQTVTQPDLDWKWVIRHLLDLIQRDDERNENQLLTDLFRSLTSPFVQLDHSDAYSDDQTVSIERVFSLLRQTLANHSVTPSTARYCPPIASHHELDITLFLIDQLMRHLKTEPMHV